MGKHGQSSTPNDTKGKASTADALSDKDWLEMMSLVTRMDTGNNYHWVLKRYHKYHPVYLYRSWRGKRTAKRLSQQIDSLFERGKGKQKNATER